MGFVVALVLAIGAAVALTADEGMWRIDQLPLDVIAGKYGVRLTPADLERLRYAPVRLLSGGGGGTGTFASAHGLILTNHHVALDCIRTSTLAEQNKSRADNLIESGFTAKSPSEELPCARFKAQVERSARDVTAEVNKGVTPDMAIADIQRVRQAARSDLERACQIEKGDRFSCAVLEFNSGAALTRCDFGAVLDGPGALLYLNGLLVLDGERHGDYHTVIDHAQPHCESHEFVNGVFDGSARGVFNGRIIVRPGAQRTDSKQTNNNLILSGDARADSQPQLEIYADDVKCTHGSTTGPIDQTALFYLRSRGLGAAAARAVLTYGFGADILARIGAESVRVELDEMIRSRLLAGAREAAA